MVALLEQTNGVGKRRARHGLVFTVVPTAGGRTLGPRGVDHAFSCSLGDLSMRWMVQVLRLAAGRTVGCESRNRASPVQT
jgi:hypothetical protein